MSALVFLDNQRDGTTTKLKSTTGYGCVCVCGNGMFRWVRRVERKTGTPNEIFRAVREINRKGNHNSVPYIECNNPYACSHGLFSFKMLLNVLSRFKKYFYYFCARCPFVHFKGIWVFSLVWRISGAGQNHDIFDLLFQEIVE